MTSSVWGLAVDPAGIPPTLKREHRWVVWTAVKKGEKTTKVPRQARDVSRGASVNKPLEWATFDEAMTALGSNNLLSGVGFVMTGVAGIIAVDLDNCVSLGVIAEWAQDIVDRLPGYWELSPSGRGLRGFFLGTLPGKSFLNREHGIEMYGGDSPRYVTVTGHRLDVSTADLVTAPVAQMAAVYQEYCTAGSQDVVPHADMPPPVADLSAVLQRARRELSASHVDYLDRGVADDHSVTLYSLCIALFNCGFEEDEVFAVLSETPHIVAVGERHWAGKALDYLWRRCVLPAKGKSSRVRPEDFNDVPARAGYSNKASTHAVQQKQAKPLSDLDWQQATANRFLSAPPPAQEMVVENLIPAGKFGVLAGAGGSSKSTFLIALSLQIASGVDVLGVPGWTVPKPRKVAYLAAEEDEDDLHRRVAACVEARRHSFLEEEAGEAQAEIRAACAEGRFLIVPVTGFNVHLANEEGRTPVADQLEAILEEQGIEVIILDPMASFRSGHELELQSFVETVREIASKLSATVIVAHHTNKISRGDNGRREAYEARGATQLVDGARFVLSMGAMSENEAKLRAIAAEERHDYTAVRLSKTNYSRVTGEFWFRRSANGVLSAVRFADAAKLAVDKRKEEKNKVLAFLRTIREAEEIMPKTRFVERVNNELGLPRLVARGHVEGLLDSGQAIIKHLEKGDPRRRQCNQGYITVGEAEVVDE